jgi:NADH:ubiquinone oxidoreductase subunit 4 (subunit M)
MEGPATGVASDTVMETPTRTGKRTTRKTLRDLSWSEFAVLAPLLALMIVFGVIPGALTNRIERSVQQLLPPITASHTAPARHTASGRVELFGVHGQR